MKCPFCRNEDLKVMDSRACVEVNAIRRRRQCLACSKRFTTFESVELAIQVKKRDGCWEDFQEEKLIAGLNAACRHTKISRDQVISLASSLTSEIIERQINQITTKELGEMVMKRLKSLDAVAYIRFACVYCRFKDIDEVIKAIESTWQSEDHVVS